MTKLCEVYLEQGSKRTFAGALAWPGWCRSGRNDEAALDGLLATGARYASVLHRAKIAFEPPTDVAAFHIAERLPGTTTTDFGAPDAAPAYDSTPIDPAERKRFEQILRACWHAFDEAVAAARGVQLSTGPRGGGRDLDKIAEHVLGAEQGYTRRLAWKLPKDQPADLKEALAQTHQAALDAFGAAARGETPERGPRGGAIWQPRYFVRRVAWHVLDHAWEIADRA